MKIYEKILIFFEIILSLVYSMIVLAGYKTIADGVGSLFGSLLFLFLISYFMAYLISKFSKKENKKLALWKAFIKIYPLLLVLVIIGTFNK